MIEILILIHFGFFGVVVIVMKAHAKMKDSKDLSKFNPWAGFTVLVQISPNLLNEIIRKTTNLEIKN